MEYWGGATVAERPVAARPGRRVHGQRRRRRAAAAHRAGPPAPARGHRRARRRGRAGRASGRDPDDPVPYTETKGAVLLHILEELFQHLGQMELTRDAAGGGAPAMTAARRPGADRLQPRRRRRLAERVDEWRALVASSVVARGGRRHRGPPGARRDSDARAGRGGVARPAREGVLRLLRRAPSSSRRTVARWPCACPTGREEALATLRGRCSHRERARRAVGVDAESAMAPATTARLDAARPARAAAARRPRGGRRRPRSTTAARPGRRSGRSRRCRATCRAGRRSAPPGRARARM